MSSVLLMNSQIIWQQSFFASMESSQRQPHQDSCIVDIPPKVDMPAEKEMLTQESGVNESPSTKQELSCFDNNNNDQADVDGQSSHLASQNDSSSHFVLFPFQKLDVGSFYEQLRAYHKEKVIKVALNIFQAKMTELNSLAKMCLAYTGSDGRGEKLSLSMSRLEMICIVNKQSDLQSGIVQKVVTILQQHPLFFDVDLETKCLETDSLISFVKEGADESKEGRCFPTRALDASYLIGDESIFKKYKITFYQQIEDVQNQKELKHFSKDVVKASMRVFRRFSKGEKTHIDLAMGMINYDNKKVKGTKFLFLRAVQYKLAEHIFKNVNKIKSEDLINMPSTVVERIQWLADRKFLKIKSEQIQQIQKAYTVSLIWLGCSQKRFELENCQQMIVPLDELQQVTQTIDDFCHNTKIFV